MARPNPIRKIMETPLPSVTCQKTKPFRPTDADVIYAYNLINRYVFDKELRRPEITQATIRKAWGWCYGQDVRYSNGSYCKIHLMNKWFSPQWFMNTLAHEMAHQYQWDVIGPEREANGQEPIMSHGPTFFIWRERFDYYGLNLKTAHRMKKWFQYQDFRKC
jgi:hypothetical protein